MNKVVLMGRLTKDPEIRNTQSESAVPVARYTLAVDRRRKKEGEQSADFVGCVVFGKGAEFAEKYLHKGVKVAVVGRIQTGSYTNKDGAKVYTTDVVVEEQEFAESKAANEHYTTTEQSKDHSPESYDEFAPVKDDVYEDLPFN